MKKLFAVVLALALCCLLLPSLAEGTDLTGTWYLNRTQIEGKNVSLVENDFIVLEITADNTFTMSSSMFAETKTGTAKVENGVLILTAGEETLSFVIEGDELKYDIGTQVLYMSRTPGETMPLPVFAPAEKAEDFNGTWLPVAQVAYGFYVEMDEETRGTVGTLTIENGKITVQTGAVEGLSVDPSVYECTFSDGMLLASDNTLFPSEMGLSLREDGSLFYDVALKMSEELTMETTTIFVRAEAEK